MMAMNYSYSVIPGRCEAIEPRNPYFLADAMDCFASLAPNDDRQCLVPKICRASAGLAISRPARRAQAAIASINCPFEVTLVPSAR